MEATMYLVHVKQSTHFKEAKLSNPNFDKVMKVCNWLATRHENIKFEIIWKTSDRNICLGEYLGFKVGWKFREEVLEHIA